MNRRRQMLLSAGAGLAPAFLRAAGPNNRIRLAIAGVKGRGWFLARTLADMKPDNVEIVALCDPDSEALAQRVADLAKAAGAPPAASHKDMRRAIDDKSIDAILHATPTNWHALGAVWTLQAGKDAYVEKPLGLTLDEGEQIVAAARRYNRIVQHGTQCRSSPQILEAVDQLRRGIIGEVRVARCIGHKYRPSIGQLKPATPPSTLDYDLWRGPAPMKPYSANQVHYNWHWFWDTGNGDLGNLAVHNLDVVRMAMKLEEFPEQVHSSGGTYFFDDAKQTPNYQTSTFVYGKSRFLIESSIRNGYSNTEAGMGSDIPFTLGDRRDAHGMMFYGTEGYMVLPDYISYYTYLGRDRKPGPKTVGSGPADPVMYHLRNFLEAMRSRNREHLNCEAEQGRRSAALCQYANIAYRTGKALRIDPATGNIAGGDDATLALTRRTYRKGYELPASA